METKTEEGTSVEIVFNLVKALLVIQSDKSLTELLRGEYNTSFELMIASAKEGLFKAKGEEFVKSIFDKLIVTKPQYLKKYNTLVEEVVIPTTKAKKVKKVKEVVEGKVVLPRWYGKSYIDVDIKANGGKVSEIQRAMFSVNELKNIFSKLNRKGIADMLGDGNNLSDKDCRDIIATVDTLKKKLKDII